MFLMKVEFEHIVKWIIHRKKKNHPYTERKRQNQIGGNLLQKDGFFLLITNFYILYVLYALNAQLLQQEKKKYFITLLTQISERAKS